MSDDGIEWGSIGQGGSRSDQVAVDPIDTNLGIIDPHQASRSDIEASALAARRAAAVQPLQFLPIIPTS